MPDDAARGRKVRKHRDPLLNFTLLDGNSGPKLRVLIKDTELCHFAKIPREHRVVAVANALRFRIRREPLVVGQFDCVFLRFFGHELNARGRIVGNAFVRVVTELVELFRDGFLRSEKGSLGTWVAHDEPPERVMKT